MSKPVQVPILQTERLRLRPLTPADADALFAAYSDPEAMRFMPSPPHQSVAETRQFLTDDMSLDGARHWAICLRENDAAIGLVNYLGSTRLPGMGYILQRDYWGRGIATEACRAALAFGFEQLGFDRVELWINEDNFASQRVARKLNFRLKGQLAQRYPHNPQHHVMLVYGIWSAEWRGEEQQLTETRFFQAQPVLMVHDVAATAAFYKDKLGFRVDFLYGDPPNHGAVSRGDWNGGMVTVQFTRVPPERPLAHAGYLYIIVDTSLDDLYAAYKARGVEMLDEPTTYPYGMREFTIRDLNGHLLQFATHSWS